MNYVNQRAKDVAQLEEYLTSMHEILGSIPSTAKTDQEWRHMPVLPAFGRQRQETQKFKVNLYYSMSLRTALATWNLSFSQQASNPDKFHTKSVSVPSALSAPPHKVEDRTATGGQERAIPPPQRPTSLHQQVHSLSC